MLVSHKDGLNYAGETPSWFKPSVLGRFYAPENDGVLTAGEAVTVEMAEAELRNLDRLEAEAIEVASAARTSGAWRCMHQSGKRGVVLHHTVENDPIARAVAAAHATILACEKEDPMAEALYCILGRQNLRTTVTTVVRRGMSKTMLTLGPRPESHRGGPDWFAERRAFWRAIT